ncbi:unnamed protein product [Camellia sinensis]
MGANLQKREEQSKDTLSEEGYLPGTLLHLIKSITGGANEKDFTLVLAIRGKVISYNVKSKTLKELHHLSTDDLDDWGASWYEVHEMAMVSAIQEAQKDNLRSFNDYMMTVLEGDSLIMSLTSSPQVSSGQFSMELLPLANKPVLERKAAAYAEVVKNLNNAREHSFPFKKPQKSIQEIAKALTGSLISLKVIQADQENRKLIFSEKEAMWYQQINVFKGAYESLGLDASSGKSVSMQKI